MQTVVFALRAEEDCSGAAAAAIQCRSSRVEDARSAMKLARPMLGWCLADVASFEEPRSVVNLLSGSDSPTARSQPGSWNRGRLLPMRQRWRREMTVCGLITPIARNSPGSAPRDHPG
jgi:hypothetical protein